MKITKTQLRQIVSEELAEVKKTHNLDELFGFGKKKKKAAPVAPTEEDPQAELARSLAAHKVAQDEKYAKEKEEFQKSRDDRSGINRYGLSKEDPEAKKYAAMKKRDEKSNQNAAKRNRASARHGTGGQSFQGNTAGAGRYAANRKDESQLRKRIKEEVSKALKANFTFKK